MNPVSKLISSPLIKIREMAPDKISADQVLFPIEKRAIAKAVKKRRIEFIAGRYLARQALLDLCIKPVQIGVGKHGAPEWPSGVTGSITHCNTWCAAAVSLDKDVSYLGIDVEQNVLKDFSLWDIVCTPYELSYVKNLSEKMANCTALAIFSAKESLYKALYPRAGSLLGYKKAQIIFKTSPVFNSITGWTGMLLDNFGPYRAQQKFEGGLLYCDSNFIATACFKIKNSKK
jgi:4'-phosphopantetheinyl transferase EntD